MNPIASYDFVETHAKATILGNGQTTDKRIWITPGHTVVNPGAVAAGAPAQPTSITQRSEGFAIGYFNVQNRSAATVIFGIGGRVANNLWRAGQWVDAAATPYTDDTDDAQDQGATDFALETTTINDGYVIASMVPFNAISIDVGTSSVHAGGVIRSPRFSNAAGDGWNTAITSADAFVFSASTAAYTSGTESLLIFNMPTPDLTWGRIQASGLSGIPGGYYAMNVRATDAAETTAGVADTIGVYRLGWLQEGLTDNSLIEWDGGGTEAFFPGCDGLVAMFGTASEGNRVTALVRARG